MWQSVLVLCLMVAATSGFTVTGSGVSRCTRGGPLPVAAGVVGCTAAPCRVQQGEDSVVGMTFFAPHDITTMTTTATAFIDLGLGGVEIPVPLDLKEHSATCDHLLNAACPVPKGEMITYELRMPIEPFFPAGLMSVEFRILDEQHELVVCIRTSLAIDSPVRTEG